MRIKYNNEYLLSLKLHNVRYYQIIFLLNEIEKNTK